MFYVWRCNFPQDVMPRTASPCFKLVGLEMDRKEKNQGIMGIAKPTKGSIASSVPLFSATNHPSHPNHHS
ncbi:hypothetical protein E2P81_ATG05860 [Venturia nashicola]|uniref:Uncharacterized protein n=1 Tax=Venturia nashicola TaxID=86259 RepID=A0A4Z1NSZ2_9PEZI|nr:hypothetical protein E6O75_ATG06007 [Venturia nashicola]TLD29566.1 hypothetical protein E2P81_ATG05860 [Venturia nashicola]